MQCPLSILCCVYIWYFAADVGYTNLIFTYKHLLNIVFLVVVEQVLNIDASSCAAVVRWL